MKHYKDLNTNEVYAFEADGSQDKWINFNLVPITDQEAAVLCNVASLSGIQNAMLSTFFVETLPKAVEAQKATNVNAPGRMTVFEGGKAC